MLYGVTVFLPINTYLTSLLLAVALISPPGIPVSQKSAINPATPLYVSEDAPGTPFALEAPKTPYLSLAIYAELAAHDANISASKFKALIACESVWHETALGDNGTSIGILQFKDDTFAHFNKKYNFANRTIQNPQHQIDLATLMIRDGYLFHWKNCSRKIGWQ